MSVMTVELARGDFVVLPGERRGVVLRSHGEDDTVIGLVDGGEEAVARSDVDLAMVADMMPGERALLEAAHEEALEDLSLPVVGEAALVVVPDGREAVVLFDDGNRCWVRFTDDTEDQFARSALTFV